MNRLARNRRRAASLDPAAMFLHDLAADQLSERLSEVNRRFTNPAIVSGFNDFWAERFPKAAMVAESEVLDIRTAAHDLVVHAMSLHWANDPVGQMIQCRRALRPDGLFLGVLLGGRTLHELRSTLTEAEIETRGGLSPRVAPMAELRDLGGLLQRAGFALPVADCQVVPVSYPSVRALMLDLRAMGETSALADMARHFTPRRLIDRADAIYRQHFAEDPSRVRATFELIFLTGWAPDESQQKPLRPGSARMRLADALATTENPEPDQHR
ncbi:MAG: SAM-dependent methyltransferase [Rhodobacteraceae bacterium]|nr:SAM-dependent methyltransferase [Paracoccaceae bacterium]